MNFPKPDPYDAVNKALDELGMLSTVSQSCQEYRREKEYRLHECTLHNMSQGHEQPGPSGFQGNRSFISHVKRRLPHLSHPDAPMTEPRSEKEKENKFQGGFEVLAMNADFVTGFKAGYENISKFKAEYDQSNYSNSDSNVCGVKKVFRCSFLKRKRLRTHPYDHCVSLSNAPKIPINCNESTDDSSYYRLRTSSLSSGSKKKPSSAEKCIPNQGYGGLNRSRSMENLSANNTGEFPTDNVPNNSSMEQCSLSVDIRPKDVESVSRGIQELNMEDCT